MSEERFASDEVDRLAIRLQEGELTEEEQVALRDTIRHDPAGRRRLVEHLYLASDLRERLRHTTELLEQPKSKVIRPWMWMGAGLAAAAALVFSAVSVFGPDADDSPLYAGGGSAAADLNEGGVAVMALQMDVEWGPGTTMEPGRLKQGKPLVPAVLELASGVVQIDFFSGASVVLEGPAKMELKSPELGVLHHGRLRAHVPPPARGFRVVTATFEVLDLGTEFAMEVGIDGKGEVHVIDGEVELHQPGSSDAEPERLLKAGEGVAIDGTGSHQEIASRPADFVSVEGLRSRAQQRFENWKAFRDDLRNDPELLLYYTFDGTQGWAREEENLALHGPADTAGAIVGCQSTEGRWPGKRGMLFKSASDRVRLDLPGEYDALTMACWVRVDGFGSSRIALLHPETSQTRYVHWGLQVGMDLNDLHVHFAETHESKENQERFGAYEDRRHYHCNMPIQIGLERGNWFHLAVVYDSAAREVRHYRNGELLFTNPIEVVRPVSVGSADIGNWPYKEWAAGTPFEVRNLDGCMDEFLIFKKAMGSESIREMFESGRP